MDPALDFGDDAAPKRWPPALPQRVIGHQEQKTGKVE
jgi:hypothetical protein